MMAYYQPGGGRGVTTTARDLLSKGRHGSLGSVAVETCRGLPSPPGMEPGRRATDIRVRGAGGCCFPFRMVCVIVDETRVSCLAHCRVRKMSKAKANWRDLVTFV